MTRHPKPGHFRALAGHWLRELMITVACALLISGCATPPQPEPVIPTGRFGRDCVLQALKPPEGELNFFKKIGLVSTALSSSRLDWNKPINQLDLQGSHGGSAFSLKLADGTLVEGLLFAYHQAQDQPKPLLMASFGFLQDRWGTEAAKFYELYLKNPDKRLPADVLLLDHPTSGPFLANNRCLSVGAYDDARMWIEIGLHLKERLKPSGIHLFGVSMSGQTVVHALLEDARLGLKLFDSGMAVSMAPDFQQAPGKQLAYLETSAGVENPWKKFFKIMPPATFSDDIQLKTLGMLIKKQFIPHYRHVHPAHTQFDLPPIDVAFFLRNSFEERIALLRQPPARNWNKDFRLDDLDAFMSSTRVAGLIAQVRTPLVLVSALDDPAVEHSMYAEVLKRAEGNPWITAYETEHGGHFGFDIVYGPDYLGNILRCMMTPQVLVDWNHP